MELLIVGVLAILSIAAASQTATRVRVAAPLLLVALGVLVSLLPFLPDLPPINPEIILAGVLPPLLYSTAVSMPTMDFRRDFRAIGGLSVFLVLISAAVIGFVFYWLVPDMGLAAAIALGAILSPTDAVATTIVKRLGVSPRIVSVLQGESMLNDATALVLLRTAIVATAATVTFWGVIGQFACSVAIAVAIGLVVGYVNLRVRSKITDAAVATAISFTIPFIASIPTQFLGGSGLVAAVVAGLVTGRGAARWLTPTQRLSDERNWRTIELLLEGGVFLIMGLELSAILADVSGTASVWQSVGLALLAIVVALVIRAAYVTPLLFGLKRTAEQSAKRRDNIGSVQERFDRMSRDGTRVSSEEATAREQRLATRSADNVNRFRTRIARFVADVEYMEAEPLGFKEGVLLVWAGMRGVVTLAAAQTLPTDTPHRSLLVLVAFFVAAGSLALQGGTLGPLARRLGLTGTPINTEERRLLSDELRAASVSVLEQSGIDPTAWMSRRSATDDTDDGDDVPDPSPDFEKFRAIRLQMIEAQRTRLLELRRLGTYSSGALTWALKSLDAEQLSIELRAEDADGE